MKEKRIEVMAVENLVAFLWHNTSMYDEDQIFDVAEALVNAGYRKQEWISVEDRLPEDVYGKDKKQIVVLVHTKSGRISSASRVRECKFDKTKLKYVELDTFGWSRGLRVSHWMQLPDAPKGESNG